MTIQYTPIAISSIDALNFGCPYCGYRSAHSCIYADNTRVAVCGECGKTYVVLANGARYSAVSFLGYRPKRQRHPRAGIPSHGNPDKHPQGGEFFHSRGIGFDRCSCFVCGTGNHDVSNMTIMNNIAAFVVCKQAGERIVAMFERGAWLDYREYEPDRVQVKVGACTEHLPNLQKLDYLTQDGILTKGMIDIARG